jgi:Concanavalin A-like lectin/glucanases superfamily
MSTYRLFPSTDGPSTATKYSGDLISGVQFQVNQGGCWLEGYWWWVCEDGDQPTKAQKFALWQVYSDVEPGNLVGDATVTSDDLKAGAWNYVALTQPVPLSIGATYLAATGVNGNFPTTANQFGSGQKYAAGITDGPLVAYSDGSGSTPSPATLPQMPYSTTGTDPSVDMPTDGYQSQNLWIDVSISTTPPAGASYRLWPNYGTIAGIIADDATSQSFGTEFSLTQACTLDKIWFYSPPKMSIPATVLPTACAIWDVPSDPTTATMIDGTLNSSPTWSGDGGSGWVSCDYSSSGVTLQPGRYKVTINYYSDSPVVFYQENTHYFSTPQSSVYTVAVSLTPEGYWQLADAAGSTTAADSSGNGSNGTVSGGVTFGAAGPLQGGTVATFNGSTGSISTGLNFSSSWSTLSFAAFVRVASGATGTLGVVGNSAASMSLLSSSGDLAIQLSVGGSAVSIPTTTSWGDDEWHFVAITWDASSGDVYGYLDPQDGYPPTGTATLSATLASSTGGIDIGSVGGADFFDGGLAHVIVTDSSMVDDSAPASLWNPAAFVTGPAWNGITSGPLSTPNIVNAGAAIGNWTNLPMTGNSSYSNPPTSDVFVYPSYYDVKDDGEVRWVDVEVTEAAAPPPPPVPASPSVILTFLP